MGVFPDSFAYPRECWRQLHDDLRFAYVKQISRVRVVLAVRWLIRVTSGSEVPQALELYFRSLAFFPLFPDHKPFLSLFQRSSLAPRNSPLSAYSKIASAILEAISPTLSFVTQSFFTSPASERARDVKNFAKLVDLLRCAVTQYPSDLFFLQCRPSRKQQHGSVGQRRVIMGGFTGASAYPIRAWNDKRCMPALPIFPIPASYM